MKSIINFNMEAACSTADRLAAKPNESFQEENIP
jgi:hypothetical protein